MSPETYLGRAAAWKQAEVDGARLEIRIGDGAPFYFDPPVGSSLQAEETP